MGYEKTAHLYDLFDTKENIEFFFHYASEAGEVLDIGARDLVIISLAEKSVRMGGLFFFPSGKRNMRMHSYESLYMFAWLKAFSSGWALHADWWKSDSVFCDSRSLYR